LPEKSESSGLAASDSCGQVEEPRRHHAAAPPQLGDRGEVEVVLVVLGVAERGRLGVDVVAALPMLACLRMFRPSA
jgi:hypothetical protein